MAVKFSFIYGLRGINPHDCGEPRMLPLVPSRYHSGGFDEMPPLLLKGLPWNLVTPGLQLMITSPVKQSVNYFCNESIICWKGWKMSIKSFPKPKMPSYNVYFRPQLKDIRFTVRGLKKSGIRIISNQGEWLNDHHHHHQVNMSP